MKTEAPEWEKALVCRLRQGDALAFRELLAQYATPLTHYVTRMTTAGTDVEGLVQETFLRLWKHRQSVDSSHGRLSAWLYRVAHNLAIDALRKQKPEQPLAQDPLDDGYLQDAQAHAQESSAPQALGFSPPAAQGFLPPVAQGCNPEEAAMVASDAAEVRGALAKLPPRQRSALLLCHYQGFTNREAAALLSVSVEALESLLSRARSKLRAVLVADNLT